MRSAGKPRAGPRSACPRRPRRRAAVDGVDADQRREALGAARRAHRAGDAVAGDELAALDLGGGDVDVVVGSRPRRGAGSRAVGEQLDGALDLLVLGLGLVGLLGRRGRRGRRACAARGSASSPSSSSRARPRPPRERGSAFAERRRPRRGAAAAARAADGAPRRARRASARVVVVGLGGGASSRHRRPRRRLGGDVVLAGLVGEDGVDQVGLAQAAEAVDAELVGEQVQIGKGASSRAERSRTEGMRSPRSGSVGARPRWVSGRQPGPREG